jgi:dihydrolipoamide dehydrogenase
MQQVDTLTIGAGGGAYPGAFRLARAGQRVVMIDSKGVMSGNCLAEECVPSKAVREVSGLVRASRKGRTFGFSCELTLDYSGVIAHKDRVQRLRYAQHAEELRNRSGRLSLVKGTARFVDPHLVEVETDSGTERFHAGHIILASGADIVIPSIPGTEFCLTSRDFYALQPVVRKLPKTMLIVGGGYIGLETAAFYTNFGVKVTVLEMTDQLLPGMDPDFVGLLVPLLDCDIGVQLGAMVKRIERSEERLTVVYQLDGTERRAETEAVMLAVGRAPVLPIGTEEIGIKTVRGSPVVNAALQTSYPISMPPGM